MKLKIGFTLIEVLIYFAIFAVIMLAVSQVFFKLSSSNLKNRSANLFVSDGYMIISKISYDLSQSVTLISPVDENFVSSLEFDLNGDTVTYQVSADRLERNGVALTNKNVKVDFSSPGYGFRKIGNTIQLKFKIESTDKPITGEKQKEELQTAINLL